MGEDDEGEVGEEEAGYVGDAEVGAAVETGKCSFLSCSGVGDGADDVYRWATVVVGRSGLNDSFLWEELHPSWSFESSWWIATSSLCK